MDFESYHLRFAWFYSFNKDLALKIELPLIYYGKGSLDNTIDTWHEFFGLPRADRPNVSNNQFHIFYTKNGQPLIDLTTAVSGLADIQLAFGKKIIQEQQMALSTWLSADLPTGDSSHLTGNDEVDLSFWLASDYRFHPKWNIDISIGVLFPGADNVAGLTIEDQVYFTYAGIEWQAANILDLRIQINNHSAFYSDSQLLLLNSAYNAVFGGRIHISKCSDIDLAFSEDIQVGASPDVSFLISWKTRPDCQ